MSRNIQNFNLNTNEATFIFRQANNLASKKIIQNMKKECTIQYKNEHGTLLQNQYTITNRRRNIVPLNSISEGTYTYMFEYNNIDKKIYYKFGKVNNALEWGARHFQLKSNNSNMHVFAAGELRVNNNILYFNFLTGTYTRVVINKEQQLIPIVIKMFNKLFPCFHNIIFQKTNLLYPGKIIPSTSIPQNVPKLAIKPKYYQKYLENVVKKVYCINKTNKQYTKRERHIHNTLESKIAKSQHWSCGTLCRFLLEQTR